MKTSLFIAGPTALVLFCSASADLAEKQRIETFALHRITLQTSFKSFKSIHSKTVWTKTWFEPESICEDGKCVSKGHHFQLQNEETPDQPSNFFVLFADDNPSSVPVVIRADYNLSRDTAQEEIAGILSDLTTRFGEPEVENRIIHKWGTIINGSPKYLLVFSSNPNRSTYTIILYNLSLDPIEEANKSVEATPAPRGA